MTRSWGLVATLILVSLAVLVPGAPAHARAATKAAPPPGWDADRVRFEPLDGGALTVSGVGTYRGAIEIARTASGLAVVNDVALEDYVLGIAEVPSRWPIEALKAQAIAARTYALWEARRTTTTEHRAAGADICATEACQVYTGVAKAEAPHGERWRHAVDATRGQVLAYRGEPILAKYSSSNGGRSVPGGQPYLRAVDDPDDRYSPLHRWRVTIPLDQVGAALALPAPPVDVHQAGDAVRITMQTPDGAVTVVDLPPADFRARINAAIPPPGELPKAIPTARFVPATVAGAVVIDGRGYGHGIGMSQYGALGKAVRGMKAPDILASYYAGLRPVAVPPEHLPRTIRVAVALGQSAATVTGGAFRVTTVDGRVLAHHATGTWRLTPGRTHPVRVTPPPPQAAPPALEAAPVSGGDLAPGAAPTIRVRLGAPAIVTVTAAPPGTAAPVPVVANTLRPAGDLEIPLPPAPAPGTYQVTVAADAGHGRVAHVPVAITVAPRAAADATVLAAAPGAPQSSPPGAARTLITIVAAALVGLTALAAIALGRTHRPPLH